MYSEADCIKWFETPLINPKSGRRIVEGKSVYETLRKQCENLRNKSGKDEVNEEDGETTDEVNEEDGETTDEVNEEDGETTDEELIINEKDEIQDRGDSLKCIIENKESITFKQAVYFLSDPGRDPKTFQKITQKRKLECEAAALNYGLINLGDKKEEFYKMKDYKNWCALDESQKQDIATQFVIYTLFKKDTPVKILKIRSKWNENSKKYGCNKCDDSSNDDSFYKTLDILCATQKLNIKSNLTTNINYHTPGLQIRFSSSLFSDEKSIFGIEKKYGFSGEFLGLNNNYNFSYLPEDILRKSYNSIGIQITELKNVKFVNGINLRMYGSSPNPDNLTYLPSLKFKDNCYTLEYFKNASALDCLSNSMYEFWNLHSLFNKDENIKESEWNESLIFLQNTYATMDSIQERYKEFTPKNLKRFRHEYLKLYSNNYKVHIQPKSEYYFWTFYNLTRYGDQLKNYVSTIKINLIYDRSIDMSIKNIPIIILYPYRGQGIFDELIKLLTNIFPSSLCEQIGLDISPRFNDKINNLLYFAQGDGDFKLKMYDYETLDLYYDKSKNYGPAIIPSL